MIQSNNYTEALAVLNEIAEGDKELLQNKEWYQVVSYLGLDKSEAAKALAERIAADKNHLFSSKSVELLKELK